MATTTTNFGWDIPQSTDLVKDGATAIAALGQDIDTSLVGLKGGTTGQVLSKTSGTDMAFTWVAQDDSNAIQNAIVTTKGDLIVATGNATLVRQPVGTNGQVLTADSTQADGVIWATPASGGMTSIATGTLSGSSVALNSIPGTYRRLILRLDNVQVNAIVGLRLSVNGSSSAIYDSQLMEGRSGAIRNVYTTSESVLEYTYYRPVTGNNGNTFTLEFPDYSSSVAFKTATILGESSGADGSGTGSGAPVINNSSVAFRTTSAITSMTLGLSSSTYAGGTYTLWGVN